MPTRAPFSEGVISRASGVQPPPRGKDQADRMVRHILVIDRRRMGDRQAARPTPAHIDPVIARGETGDQPQRGQPLDQRRIQRKLARHHQRLDVPLGLDRGMLPEPVDVIGRLQKAGQRRQMPLHDQDCGALGHGAILSRWQPAGKSRHPVEGFMRVPHSRPNSLQV